MALAACRLVCCAASGPQFGQHPIFDAYGHNYTGKTVPVGETVLARVPRNKQRMVRGSRIQKGDIGWNKGIWLGKSR